LRYRRIYDSCYILYQPAQALPSAECCAQTDIGGRSVRECPATGASICYVTAVSRPSQEQGSHCKFWAVQPPYVSNERTCSLSRQGLGAFLGGRCKRGSAGPVASIHLRLPVVTASKSTIGAKLNALFTTSADGEGFECEMSAYKLNERSVVVFF